MTFILQASEGMEVDMSYKNFMKDILCKYVEKFNADDEELYINEIANEKAYEWLCEEIPLFECPDKEIEETYYFRWWTYRKHIKNTEAGYMISEFLPQVPWGGKYNEINAAVGHHLNEGRWLKNAGKYLKNYINFFLNEKDRGHQYSTWMIYATYQMCAVTDDWDLGDNFLNIICEYYEEWENTHLLPNGMFWSYDDRDAMEFSVSGRDEDKRRLKGIRPTLNAYMCADSWAIAEFAKREGNEEIARTYRKKYEILRAAINKNLWQNGFYRAFHFKENEEGNSCGQIIEKLIDKTPRELIGYIPWMFNIPEAGRESVFDYLTDYNYFLSDFGLTTVEKTCERFLYEVEHECLWNGYVWPFAISQTLTAMRNMIVNYGGREIYKDNFYEIIKQYAQIHKFTDENGKTVNWIDEVRHPQRDEWSSREMLKKSGWRAEKGGYERGKDYNHSTFCDIIISGIVGVNCEKDSIEVSPLIPEEWEYFRMENLTFRGNTYTIVYDKTGRKYNKGKGLRIICNGKKDKRKIKR